MRNICGIVTVGLTLSLGVAAPPVEAATSTLSKIYTSCAKLNVKYPHGVGLPGVVDAVKPGNEPVTTFLVDANLYFRLFANPVVAKRNGVAGGRLDADKDGIACEKL